LATPSPQFQPYGCVCPQRWWHNLPWQYFLKTETCFCPFCGSPHYYLYSKLVASR
jgi:hypothetical protein